MSSNHSSFYALSFILLSCGGVYNGVPHEVPGSIEAENYSLNGSGISYFDSTPGNLGKAYRDDDVDIEANSGVNSIAWIAQNEWLSYDINVKESGTYEVTAKVASPENRIKFHFEQDGKSISKVLDQDPTGGWYNWQNVTLKDIELEKGSHELKLVFDNDEFNIDNFEISLQEDDSEPDETDTCSGNNWNEANLTWYESYPDPGSAECIEYNGCQWAGQFAGIDGVKSEAWVKDHNIAAVHSKDFSYLNGKTIRIVSGGNQIDAVVYDMCADSDCNGCCTENLGSTGYLIDLEKYTADRFGIFSGDVQWKVCN